VFWENSALAVTVGIDLGGDSIRFAADEGGKDVSLPAIAPIPVPRVIRVQPSADASEDATLEILSVKRLLDFDVALPVPPRGKNSIDFLSEELARVKSTLDHQLSNKVVNWAVAVPPCFSQRQRSSIRTACTNAGLHRVRLMDDTRAVLMASLPKIASMGSVLVCTWGASTFSSVLYRKKGQEWGAAAQGGDSTLGGDDIDATLCSAVLAKARDLGLPVPDNDVAHFASRALRPVREASRSLAQGAKTDLGIAEFSDGPMPAGVASQSLELTPDVFLACADGMIEKALTVTRALLQDAGSPGPDCLLLAGGMTSIPVVRESFSGLLEVPAIQAESGAVLTGTLRLGRDARPDEWARSEKRAESQPPKRAAAVKSGDELTWAKHFIPTIEQAEAAERSGRTEAAVAAVDKLFKDLAQFTGELYRRQADRMQHVGDLEKAHDLLRRAYLRDGSNRLVAMDYARMCHRLALTAYEQKEMRTALRHAENGAMALELLPAGSTESLPALASLLHLKGYALFGLGYLSDARESLARCVELMPDVERYQNDLSTVDTAIEEDDKKRQMPAKKRLKGSMRNAPCPCGSGKKYKNCCLNA